ncbi:MAG: peptidyl-alpha-hydroxyglycine alpha-amidating lyase family protein [Pseudomonadales bacterium]
MLITWQGTTGRACGVAMLLGLLGLPGAASAGLCGEPGYRAEPGWGELPQGREWGATSALYPTRDGKHIWVAERCGANLCVGSDADPVLLFDLDGKLVRSFGAGLIAWPHGIFVDQQDNVWITDAVGYVPVPEGWGHVVYKFSPEGELLLTLGQRGVAGDDEHTLRKPNDLVVAANGDIFVADGHGSAPGEPVNNRIVRYSADGTYQMEFGIPGAGKGEIDEPHAIAIDSQGRLFVGDRGNSRILLFDQQGNHLATWTQFGRPSGLYIDANDVLYVADSESNARRNPGWKRGIRIGSAVDGFVTAFIPDPEPDQDNSGTSGAEGVAVDAHGNVYGAEVGPRQVVKYVPLGPSDS